MKIFRLIGLIQSCMKSCSGVKYIIPIHLIKRKHKANSQTHLTHSIIEDDVDVMWLEIIWPDYIV